MGIKDIWKKITMQSSIPFTQNVYRSAQIGPYSYTPEYLLGLDPQALKSKALQIWWRSIHARGAIRQLNVLTVNSGLRLQSQPNKQILNITSDRANEISNNIESLFSVWRLQKECSYDGTKNYNELESIAKYSWDIFGEYFALVRYSKDKTRFSPVNIQMINPMTVKNPPDIGKKDIQDGIEYRRGTPIAIYIESIGKNGSVNFERVPFRGAKSGKVFVLHGFDAEIPGAKRGTPKLAPVFHELERIQEALRFEIESMGTNAMIAFAIERTKPVVDNEKIKRQLQGTSTVDSTDPITRLDSKTVTNNKGGNIIQNGEPGETFKPFDTTRPNINIPEFIRKEIDWIGPAIGISSELWLMLFGKAYSASKGSIDLSFKNFEAETSKFASGFSQVILEAVIDSEIATGGAILPGWTLTKQRAAYMVARWIGVPQPSLNPFQEAKASTEKINNMTSNREIESQKLTGVSFDQNADRQFKEAERIIEINDLYAVSEVDPEADEL